MPITKQIIKQPLFSDANQQVTQRLDTDLQPRFGKANKKLTLSPTLDRKSIEKRWKVLEEYSERSVLLDESTISLTDRYQKNIEYFIGTAKVPIGIAGPLRVNGTNARDDFLVPLATTEAALVASYHRGANLITKSGGASALVINEGVSRSPVFQFKDLSSAGQFVAWVVTQYDTFRELVKTTTNHGQLVDVSVNLEGNHVYLVFEYRTGDASGQNMVTIATQKVFTYIRQHSPVSITASYLDGNLSGDKKPNIHALRGVRGRKVIAEVRIPRALVNSHLHCTPEQMVQFGHMTTTGAQLSGQIGVNAHYANGLAAIFIACGQDVACVGESSVGITRMELDDNGDLYASVTLPNLMVGTVGGGTNLPTQKACLDILGLHGNGKANALAEVCAALCLAGELSIVGAFCADHFSRAHQKLAR